MPTSFTVPAVDLEAALRSVRFAVGDHPDLPALHGVLLDLHGSELRAVATDRYRLAVSTATVTRSTDGISAHRDDVTALVPAAFVDDVLTSCADAGDAPVTVSIGPDVAVGVGGRVLTTARIDEPFPQWEPLVDLQVPHQVTLKIAELRDDVLAAASSPRERNGVHYESCMFRVSGDGLVWLAPQDDTQGAIGVNRDFLLEAIDALHGQQLLLRLNSPTAPLALSSPDRPGALSILMPVHLD